MGALRLPFLISEPNLPETLHSLSSAASSQSDPHKVRAPTGPSRCFRQLLFGLHPSPGASFPGLPRSPRGKTPSWQSQNEEAVHRLHQRKGWRPAVWALWDLATNDKSQQGWGCGPVSKMFFQHTQSPGFYPQNRGACLENGRVRSSRSSSITNAVGDRVSFLKKNYRIKSRSKLHATIIVQAQETPHCCPGHR